MPSGKKPNPKPISELEIACLEWIVQNYEPPSSDTCLLATLSTAQMALDKIKQIFKSG